MTEKEYINVGDLEKVRAARRLLNDIVAESSDIIDGEKKGAIERQLYFWEEKLSASIEVEVDDDDLITSEEEK